MGGDAEAPWKRRRVEEGGGCDGGMGGAPRGFKTQMCKFFMQGSCQKADSCTYAHHEGELQGGGKGGGKSCWGGCGSFGGGDSWGGGGGGGGGGWGGDAGYGKGGFDGGFGKGGCKGGGKGGGKGFKTQMCKYFQNGSCQKGDQCTYAHGEHELGGAAGGMSAAPQGLMVPSGGAMSSAEDQAFNQLMGELQGGAPAAADAPPPWAANNAGGAPAPWAANGAGGDAGGGGKGGAPRGFKTAMCKFFQMGTCQKGDGCTYAHGEYELQPGSQRLEPTTGQMVPSGFKTQMCKFHMMGSCQKGEACTYAHHEYEMKGGGKGGSSCSKGGGGWDGKGGKGGGWDSWGPPPDMMNMMAMKGMPMAMKGMMMSMKGGGGGGGMMALGMGGDSWGKGKGKGGGGGGFKTKMCTFFLEGRCTKGEACTYAHDPSEMSGGKGGGGKSFGGGAPAAVQLPAGLFANAGAFGAPVDDLDSMLMQQMQEAAGAEAFEAVDPSAFGLS